MNNINISLRSAIPFDSKAIYDIEQVCFSDPWSENAILEFMNFQGNTFLCAFDGDKLCGYISATFILDEMQIANVAVSPQYRRKGIASLLIEDILRACQTRQVAFATLEVRKSNIPAISLYEKFGFKAEGVRKNYYSNPTEDAIIMNKTYAIDDKGSI